MEKKEVASLTEVNECLLAGFKLSGVKYILEKADSPKSEPVKLGNQMQPSKFSIPNIDWRAKDGNDSFSWSFVGDREGKVSKENAAFRDLLKQKGSITQDGYEYKLSKDEHLFSRIKHSEK